MRSVSAPPRLATLLAAPGVVLTLTGCVPESPSVPAPGAAPAAPNATATPAPTVAPAPTPAATPTPEPPPPVILNEVAPGISITPDNQIVVEWEPDDTAPPNLFDLDGKSLVFTPEGNGGYSRTVRPLAWEDNIGRSVADEEEIRFQGFRFDFAGQSWGSFFVSRSGLITFGEKLNYDRKDDSRSTMQELAAHFITTPTIGALYKPLIWGRIHVSTTVDRAVVTWFVSEHIYHVHGLPPDEPSRFQLVLRADGRVLFNYDEIAWRDGVVGLFPNEDLAKGDLIARLTDEQNPALPGHLDILDVSIYETNTDAVLVEFTMRSDIPNAPDGEVYSYRLLLDTDEPYFPHPVHWSDGDMNWTIDVGSRGRSAGVSEDLGTIRILAGDADNRLAFLATLPDGSDGISAGLWAEAVHFDRNGYVQSDGSGTSSFQNAGARSPVVDLSRSGNQVVSRQNEVFRYRKVSGLDSMACSAIEALGDEFDVLVLHSESRIDKQTPGTPWRGWMNNVEGVGIPIRRHNTPCESDRLLGRFHTPIWIRSSQVLNRDVLSTSMFFHEFTHVWVAKASYLRNGVAKPLFGDPCNCHWLPELHLPAAFPETNGIEQGTLMGGRYWDNNADGTFTPRHGYLARNRHSWLDLYLMGLAEAREVPDMFVLRNVRALSGQLYSNGPHAGNKETVTIEEIIAAMGPRVPSAASAQKDFNAAFVYLVEPGQSPDASMLRLHRDWLIDSVAEWSSSTGGRSRITTRLPGVANHPR